MGYQELHACREVDSMGTMGIDTAGTRCNNSGLESSVSSPIEVMILGIAAWVMT